MLSAAIVLAALLSSNTAHHAEASLDEPSPLITELCEAIRDNYVFPDVAERTASHIEDLARNGTYDGLEPSQLAAALTRDLREYTNDRHFGVRPLPPGWTPPVADEQPADPEPIDPAQHAPHGVENIERLPGNIAYLNLTGFHPVDHARHSIIPAIQLMQGSSAVIIDLRNNGGGDPDTVQLLCSYFFNPAEPVHLNSLYFRPTDETTEFWTNPEHPELCMPDTPLYILTSNYTFSGAEECSYNFQTRDRATIIGETTGGGAHPVNNYFIDNTLIANIPVGRAINPVTKTNWEGTGVSPDIAVPADQALDTALNQAYNALVASGNPNARWGLYQLAARTGSVTIDTHALAEYAGNYTDREIKLDNDHLAYRRVGSPAWRPLVPVDADAECFMIEGMGDFYLRFQRDDTGTITAVQGNYRAGHTDLSTRAD